MTSPIEVPVTGYASVADYELRTGTDVPVEQEPSVQTRLNDTSLLINVYLGDCAEQVAEAHPDVLTALTVSHVYRASAVPLGVRTESVGGTSVSYDTESVMLGLSTAETDLLDNLMDATCGRSSAGIGQIGVNLGGPEEDDYPVWMWVLSGGYRKGLPR